MGANGYKSFATQSGRLQLDAGSVKAPFSRQKSRKIAFAIKTLARKSPAARNVVTHLLIHSLLGGGALRLPETRPLTEERVHLGYCVTRRRLLTDTAQDLSRRAALRLRAEDLRPVGDEVTRRPRRLLPLWRLPSRGRRPIIEQVDVMSSPTAAELVPRKGLSWHR